jgi:cytochrome c
MKKAALFFVLSFGLLSLTASAQTTKPETSTPFTIADSATYTGKYKFEGLPFEYMEVSVKDNKLFYSGGEYSGSLDPQKDKKDVFDAGGVAVFTFLRDKEGKKVTEMQIDYEGQSYFGKKEEKKS